MHQLLSQRRVALFGGVYSNYLALEAAIADARARGAEAMYCLGDVGGFGPHPDRVFPLLRQASVRCIQGNYDASIAEGAADCGCGYTDPRDNYFARLSYQYTVTRTSYDNRRWLAALPRTARILVGHARVLLCHGSPRQINEFLWETTTPSGLIDKFCRESETDVLCFTHTGIKWHRVLASGHQALNVGVLGRPENDGTPRVWYTLVTGDPEITVEFVPIRYDVETLATEMVNEGLPTEFTETIRTGWWTCCLESMPVKERGRGRY
jgi:predicted phosphodiesterase